MTNFWKVNKNFLGHEMHTTVSESEAREYLSKQRETIHFLDGLRDATPILDTGGDRNFEIYKDGYIGARR